MILYAGHRRLYSQVFPPCCRRQGWHPRCKPKLNGVQKDGVLASIVRSPLRAREKVEPDPDTHERSIFQTNLYPLKKRPGPR
jgi:hypothetical protein